MRKKSKIGGGRHFRGAERLMVYLLRVDAESILAVSFVEHLVADSLDCIESITARVTKLG